MDEFITQLIGIVGDDGLSVDEAERKKFSRDTWVLSDLQDYLGSENKALVPFLVEQLREYRNSYDFEDDICIICLDKPP